MVAAILFFNPSATALLFRGLMKAGFFQPDVAQMVDKQYSTYLPEFYLQNKAGTMIDLQDLNGKVVLINFFATWYPPLYVIGHCFQFPDSRMTPELSEIQLELM